MVSIHGPLGYGPSTLPLRHSAIDEKGAPEPLYKGSGVGNATSRQLWCNFQIHSRNPPARTTRTILALHHRLIALYNETMGSYLFRARRSRSNLSHLNDCISSKYYLDYHYIVDIQLYVIIFNLKMDMCCGIFYFNETFYLSIIIQRVINIKPIRYWFYFDVTLQT